jgi:predicted transcriptional regulator
MAGNSDEDQDSGIVEKEDLVTVYTALLEVAQSQEGWGVKEVSERADREQQMTEIALDELEHMGFVEIRDGRWYPKVRFKEE